ncbi:MAG: trypsin-like peptidase domain-containing protein [Myxococcales bacterium]|nr:trypsin-like peptidase domain-containing protein [Myxococcales bacterium]MBP6846883.1 trypsin-like peptidase domain-containing protein [Kofleriaceae bacterium]
MRTPLVVASLLFALAGPAAADELTDLRRAFRDASGAELVFTRGDLPRGDWFEQMPELASADRVAAARILVAEARHYPAGWLGAIGLTRVGVFAGLASTDGDGFRPWDDALGGYRYFGLWNGKSAIAAAYYTDQQLPLTFHHEVFHHVDGASGFRDDDAGFAAAVDGTAPYAGLALGARDLATLAAKAGDPLAEAVSDYTAKSAGEDQAETARWLHSHLATGLWQAAARPELEGSQRILHVLAEYAAAGGPSAAALVDVALGRAPAAATPTFAQRAEAAIAALRARVAPAGAWTVWGREDRDGGNPTLRADVARFATTARDLAQQRAPQEQRAAVATKLVALLDGYRGFIAGRWTLSAGTAAVFDRTRAEVTAALVPAAAPATPATPANPYLAKVDAAITDPTWRTAIRGVQPAVVKLGGGSGVNLAATGLILTAAHVVDEVGRKLTVRFPDGREFAGVTTHLDADLDLALVALTGARGLPVARLAAAAPAAGDDVVVIGQPGTRTPDGEATGYQPWHVSVGAIRGFRAGARTGEQHLGRTKHDAWTYWGHSGSPLFDRRGRVVALHNSWDSTTAMRHAVTWEAIVAFLDASDALAR